jgi:hypothetical protein
MRSIRNCDFVELRQGREFLPFPGLFESSRLKRFPVWIVVVDSVEILAAFVLTIALHATAPNRRPFCRYAAIIAALAYRARFCTTDADPSVSRH